MWSVRLFFFVLKSDHKRKNRELKKSSEIMLICLVQHFWEVGTFLLDWDLLYLKKPFFHCIFPKGSILSSAAEKLKG